MLHHLHAHWYQCQGMEAIKGVVTAYKFRHILVSTVPRPSLIMRKYTFNIFILNYSITFNSNIDQLIAAIVERNAYYFTPVVFVHLKI